MDGAKPVRSAVLAVVASCALRVAAAEPTPGGVQGVVADPQGAPVAGALVSIFGGGLRAGLSTFSDDEGRFSLATVPAGSYTLRAVSPNRRPAPARRITVLPEQRAWFAVSLAPQSSGDAVGEGVEVAAEDDPAADAKARSAPSMRELRWALRHRERSVLEARRAAAEAEAQRAWLAFQDTAARPLDLAGRLELLANASTTSADNDAATPSWDVPTGFGALRLDGRLTEHVSWSLGGLLAESEDRAWRMAAEFVIEPGGGHEITAGSGYGSGALRRPLPGGGGERGERGSGVLFARDTYRFSREWAATAGVRWSYLGFLRADNYVDPSAGIEWSRGGHVVRASAMVHTLAPGGDLLTLSSLSTAPPVTYAAIDPGLRAERVTRYELELRSAVGDLTVGARAFREGTRDQLVNLFEEPGAGGLRILNAQGVVSTGVGLSLGRRLGRAVSGSIEYALGVARRGSGEAGAWTGVPETRGASARARFHDVVARVETLVEGTDTRVVAYYRINTLSPDDGLPYTSARFDVQLNQGLPFLTSLTRADWELLLAVRNLFYEDSEGGLLDEVAVQNPPKRVVGGFSVRF